MDKVEEIKVIEILKNNNGDLKIIYNIKLSHCGATWWVNDLTAIYRKYYDVITEIERPTRTKQNKIISLILKYLIDNKYINE